jgi:hypothetical protein
MNRLNVVSDEVEQLIEGVRAVRGGESIENHLYVHTGPGNVSALQGNKAKPTGQRSMLSAMAPAGARHRTGAPLVAATKSSPAGAAEPLRAVDQSAWACGASSGSHLDAA